MPKAKKNESTSDSDSGPEDKNPPPAKKSKDGSSSKSKTEEIPEFWTLEKMRRVHINEFRGRKMVDIREYYEKGGDTLPGKKGISLSATQWSKLMEYADEITKALND